MPPFSDLADYEERLAARTRRRAFFQMTAAECGAIAVTVSVLVLLLYGTRPVEQEAVWASLEAENYRQWETTNETSPVSCNGYFRADAYRFTALRDDVPVDGYVCCRLFSDECRVVE